jgi:NAD(P)-dependent dehydrogenase (short-subunit alcohol dehydrogenase family)
MSSPDVQGAPPDFGTPGRPAFPSDCSDFAPDRSVSARRPVGILVKQSSDPTPIGTKPVAIVTGASSGIGDAIARALVVDGYRVFGGSRRTIVAPGVEPIAIDVDDDDSVTRGVADVLGRTGRIDVLVNNAGYLLAGAIEEIDIDQAKAQFETNYFGVARMTKAVLPSMRARQSGHIVTVSSLAGLVPVPFWGHYNASKFAVEALMETLRYEVRPFGVRVAMVEPGSIKTPFYAAPSAASLAIYDGPRGRQQTAMAAFERAAPGPELVARKVASLVAQRNPRLRNKITREAAIFTFLRWLLPESAFALGVRKGFDIG